MTITIEQYFGSKPHTEDQRENAVYLLGKVNALLVFKCWKYPVDPDTGTSISGSKGGAGDGGFRLPISTTGASNSKHKMARAIDVYDPEGELDYLITDELLQVYGLYREHPDMTIGWTHLQDVAPGSGNRTFIP